MNLRSYIVALFATLLAVSPAGSGSMMLLGAGKVGTVAGYAGPGDASNTFPAWGSCSFAYSAAKAAATVNMCDLVAVTTPSTGAVICTMKASTSGIADLTGTYCNSTTVPLACSAAGGCLISSVWDQVGNTSYWAQATNGNRPPLLLNAIGTHPAINCTAGTAVGLTSPSITLTVPFSVNAVMLKMPGNGAVSGIFWQHNGGNTAIGYTSGVANTMFMSPGTTTDSTHPIDGSGHAVQGIFATGTNGMTLVVDGFSTTGTATPLTATAASIICNNGSVLGGDYYVGEVGPNTLTSYSAALRADALTRWGF